MASHGAQEALVLGCSSSLDLFFLGVHGVLGTANPRPDRWVWLSGSPLATCSAACLVHWAPSLATAWTAFPSSTG